MFGPLTWYLKMPIVTRSWAPGINPQMMVVDDPWTYVPEYLLPRDGPKSPPSVPS